MKLIRIALLSFALSCQGDVLVDFNTEGDLGRNFTGRTGGFIINETANEGLQHSRGANIANAEYSQIEVYNKHAYPGNLPQWEVGAYVNLLGDEWSNLSLGLVDSTNAFINTAGQNPYYVQPAQDWLSIGMTVNRRGDVGIYNNNTLLASKNIGVLTESNSWFHIKATGVVVNGAYLLIASVFHSDAIGNIGNQVGSPLIVAGISNPQLLNTPATYFFFGTAERAGRTLDNFQITLSPFCSPHAAKADAQIMNGAVAGAIVTDTGCGYTNTPSVRILGGAGTGAAAIAVMTGGIVTDVIVTSTGTGYTSIPRVLIESPPFVPSVAIQVSRVNVTQRTRVNHNYVLESSDDLINWTPTGPSFTADREEITSELFAAQTGQYFRLREVP